MEIQGYFTGKGLALSTKLLTGAALSVTRVVAGGGSTADPLAATSLPQPKQTLAVNPPSRSGNTATLPVTLAAALAREAYTLTELGVYARDPNEGEILYKVYRLGEPVDIKPDSRMVLRFYLEETVSQDLGVTVERAPAGLITETDFAPVREKVMRTAVSYREVEVAAVDLPAYLAALPRLLTENLVIHVSGTVEEPISLNGFYGNGVLWLKADALGDWTVKNIMTMQDCSVRVSIQNAVFIDSGAAAETYYKAVVFGYNARYLEVIECTFTGDGTGKAVMVTNQASGFMLRCTVRNFSSAVCAWGSRMSVAESGGSENTYGLHTYRGGIILLDGETPELMGGASNYNSGGLIVKGGKLL